MEAVVTTKMHRPVRQLVLRAACGGAMVAAWLVAGTFFAFSDFVMVGLSRLDAASGIAAMQSMNISVEERVFVFLANGLIALSVGFTLYWMFFRGPKLLGVGGLIFLCGAAVPTLIGSIPLNLTLADMSAQSSAAQSIWPAFIGDWLIFNHIRLVASIAAALCFSYAAFNDLASVEATK